MMDHLAMAPLDTATDGIPAQESLPVDYFASPLLTPYNLCVWRWTASVLCLAMIAWSATTPYYILFFTHWAWIGMAIYFLVSFSCFNSL